MNLSSDLINLVVCPVKGKKLEYDSLRQVLVNKEDKIEYPVINGIALLLESEAKKVK